MDVCTRAQTHAQSYSASFYCADVCINTPEDGGHDGVMSLICPCVFPDQLLWKSLWEYQSQAGIYSNLCARLFVRGCVYVCDRDSLFASLQRDHTFTKNKLAKQQLWFYIVICVCKHL